MPQRFAAASSSSDHHVAQQSRRDKLRVHQQRFVSVAVDGGSSRSPNPNQGININQELIYGSCTANMNMLTNSSAIYDLAASGGHGQHDSSSSCDWIVNQINSSNHPLLQSHLYHLPATTEVISAEDTLQAVVTPSLGLEIADQLVPWQQQQQQNNQFIQPLKIEGAFDHGALASETQGLSLSLASKTLAEMQVTGHSQFDHDGFPNFANQTPQLRAKLVNDLRRAVGPLGPFTGYATILGSSKFLKPAQQLLDEFCSVVSGSSKLTKQAQCDHRLVADERRNPVGGSAYEGGVVGGNGSRSVRGGNSEVSSSSFYSSTEGINRNEGGAGSGGNCSVQQRPEIQQTKVKLLYLQEEVCSRYKQYHQQMQMVVSSFESVAGLSAATPYTSLALKTISKQFRSIKHAISNQLNHMGRVLGEDHFVSSPSSISRGETMTTPRLKYLDRNLRNQKASENASIGFLDKSQPVWRPQRGLPERAVSVLRAWLFEHFLHPYPTDTDKHTLATQTGLTRNQVSNWFINARVRLWKPMVEEIHMLESKGMAEMDLNSSHKNDGKSIIDGLPYCDQGSEAQSNKQLDCSSSAVDHVTHHESSSLISTEQWHQEKRSRMEECTMPGSMDGGLMSIAYQGAVDIGGGLGAVSLTLGLRHNEDPQQQQQQQQQMRHFGNQMLRDFVG